jgi:hypothetical protein
LSVNSRTRAAPSGNASSEYPCRGWILHRIPAIRSLMQLIARLAIGVSENRRKLYGVGFGIASVSDP